MSETETGRTFLYKDGEAVIFEGAEVAEKLSEGWKDAPDPVAPEDPPTARRGRPPGSKNKVAEAEPEGEPEDPEAA